MDKLQPYVERVREVCPDLSVERASLAHTGQNNDVLVVNDQIVFRFPRYEDGARRLEIEAAILAGIQSHITAVQVPNPRWMSLSPVVREAFLGYSMIQGEQATPADFTRFDGDEAGRLVAKQMGTFLTELHAVPADRAIAVSLPIRDGYSDWAMMYAEIKDGLFPHMRPDAQAQIAGHFEDFLNDQVNFDYEPVLRHGDIGPANLIIGRNPMTIVGVIDWGTAGLGDPAVDIAWIRYRSGVRQSFLQSFFDTYAVMESAVVRAKFYAGTFPLQEALFGIENNDVGAFKRGISAYV